jgi:hypothetical protein
MVSRRVRTPRARHAATPALALCVALAAASPSARAQETSDAPVALQPSTVPSTPPSTPPPTAPAAGADAADAIGWGAASGADAAGFAPAEPAASPSAAQASAPALERDPAVLDASGHLGLLVALWSERLGSDPLAQAMPSAALAVRYKKPFHLGADRLLLRLVGEVYAEYDFAYLHDRERFDRATLDAYEFNVIGRETYAALSWGPLELTFGRQIVPFGQGEILSPLDIVNPRDTREPGLAELDATRMAVLASRAGLFVGPHRFEALVVHESYFGLRPAPLSDFSPLRKLVLDDPMIAAALADKELRYEQEPARFAGGAGQVYGRYSYNGAGVDLALYVASTLDKPGIPQAPARAEFARSVVSLPLWHPRYVAIGHAGAKPLGDFVLRWELGVDVDRPLTVQLVPEQVLSLGMVRRHQLNGLLGLTYVGLSDTQIWLEYAQRVVLDNPARDRGSEISLFSPVEAPAIALRVRRTFLRERLVATLVGTWIGVAPFIGAFGRVELAYELVDAVHVALGYAAYFPSPTERGPFYGFERDDRLYSALRWDFALYQ